MSNAPAYHSNSYLERPLTDEEKLLAHQWSLDWQIAENERLFPTNKDADYPVEPVDVPNLLADAGFKDVPPPPQPVPVGQSLSTGEIIPSETPGETLAAMVEFDEDAAKTEIEGLDVDELKENLRELDKSVSGNKAELQARLLQALKEAHDAE